jgi:photosynthetic reaction center H subunit
MQTGAITDYIDVAQIALYAFWIFFAGLVYYLRREDKREGYPLVSDRTDRTNRVRIQGFPAMPPPKTFLLPHGGTVTAPSDHRREPDLRAAPSAAWPGAPLAPGGHPLADAVGPASYALRADVPDLTIDGANRIVPMRVARDFSVAKGDPDPRGWAVVGADGESGGAVTDIWVDRSEPQVRYFEVRSTGGRSGLVPVALARVERLRRQVRVASITGAQFDGVPARADSDRVTLREEDRISAYFAGGKLYALPGRMGPVL